VTRVALIAIALAALVAAPARAVETGVNETLHQTVPTAATADKLGADWVRVWATWSTIEPSRGDYDQNVIAGLNKSVASVKAHDMKVLIVVHSAPGWAGPDARAFGRVMGMLADRVRDVDAWELWNEPDESEFFPGGPDPAKYAAMVRAAYPAIKAVQPNDTVVTGATTANNYAWIDALYANGASGHFDAVAVHTDTACLTNAPGVYYREPDGRIGRYSFTGYREVHDVMTAHGDGHKPIWMTELGWNTQSTAPNSCPVGAWADQKPLGVTEAQQAAFLTQAYQCLATDPYVTVAMWFGMQDIPGSAHAGGYGLFRLDGSPKPAADAFTALNAGIAPVRCGAEPRSALPPPPGPGSVPTVSRLRLRSRHPLRVVGRVEVAGTEQRPTGKAVVTFRKRRGGRWRYVFRIERDAHHRIDILKTVRPGRWRARLRYRGEGSFMPSRSKRLEFRVR
jgi:hypothetical protein